MTPSHFSTSILVEKSPEQAFAAINDVRAWWSGEIEGKTNVVGSEFTYRYKTLHKSTQKLTELIPGKRVVWHVTESHLGFVDNVHEWTGTEIVFDIEKRGDQTEVRFTHVGLVPAFECYGDCSGAWTFYVNDSLRALIETGKGAPNAQEHGAEPGAK
jgi:Activator of Hsp90 ATPase homolog 1-like protein